MPRKRRDKPIDFRLWTDDEKAQGYRVYRTREGQADIQSAPGGPEFVLAYDLDRGMVAVPKGEARLVRSAADLFAWAASKPRMRRGRRGERPTVGPISAEFLASELGFNAGRGQRFIDKIVNDATPCNPSENPYGDYAGAGFDASGLVPARRVQGRKRVWLFDRAALDRLFPGMRDKDWDAIMRKYREMAAKKTAQRKSTVKPYRKATGKSYGTPRSK